MAEGPVPSVTCQVPLSPSSVLFPVLGSGGGADPTDYKVKEKTGLQSLR